ncbi:MAG: hypothetical protein JJE39_10190 [Vicinamibacteria bacterium]|nr:hypothetical protein [Vicinamibacteria bacterium]
MFQRLAITCSLAFASIGCLVNVTHVSNPDRYFEEAMRNARAVAGRQGPARELHVLVYDADERKLVRVDLPLGLVSRLARDADFDWDFDDFDVCNSSRHGCSEARHRLRRFSGRDLAKLPLGPLVEVSDDDGERVFVYLR